MTPNRFVPAHLAQQPSISILVCDFDGPNGREVARRLLNDLGSQSGVMIQHLTKKLKTSGKGTLVERLVSAAATGRKWLDGANADILLWGEISPDNGAITIRFLCSQTDADTQPGSVGLGDTLEMPADYDADLAVVIHTAVLAAVGSDVYTMEIFEALARSARARLERLDYSNAQVRHADGNWHWFDITAARRDLGYEPSLTTAALTDLLKAHYQGEGKLVVSG